MNWFDKGNLVCWCEGGVRVYGKVVGVNGLFGLRGRDKGWMCVDVEIVKGFSWEYRFQIGFKRVVRLEKGKFWLWVKGSGWKCVGDNS